MSLSSLSTSFALFLLVMNVSSAPMYSSGHSSFSMPWESYGQIDHTSSSLHADQPGGTDGSHQDGNIILSGLSTTPVHLSDWQRQHFGYAHDEQYDANAKGRASSSGGSVQDLPQEYSHHHTVFNPFEVQHPKSHSDQTQNEAGYADYPPGFSPQGHQWSVAPYDNFGVNHQDPLYHQNYVVPPEWGLMFSQDGELDKLGHPDAEQQQVIHHGQQQQQLQRHHHHHHGETSAPNVIDLTDSPTYSPPRNQHREDLASPPQGFQELESHMPNLLHALYEQYQSMWTDMTFQEAQSDIRYGADAITGPHVLFGSPSDKIIAAKHIQKAAHRERSRRRIVIDE